jgi:multiple sugar transport system permease protein
MTAVSVRTVRRRRRSFRKRAGASLLTLLTYACVAILIAPIAWLIIASMQTRISLATGEYDLLNVSVDAYRTMWDAVDFARYFKNSLIICSVATLFATSFAASAGYALSRFRFRGSTSFGLGVIGTQLIPGSIFLLPLFLGFVWFNQNAGFQLFDTYKGMILVYTAFFTPVAIYLMQAFFAAIPPELEEAALVDGCTRFGAFVRVVLPNAAPGLVATAVYAFLFAWDELLFASNLTQERAETIPIGIRTFIGNYNQNYDQLMAAGVISTVPVMIAFFATQRWLVRGLTTGAVKQ